MEESCCVWEKSTRKSEQYESLTVKTLKDKLQERQLRMSGNNKHELIQRLVDNNKKDNNAADDIILMPDH